MFFDNFFIIQIVLYTRIIQNNKDTSSKIVSASATYNQPYGSFSNGVQNPVRVRVDLIKEVSGKIRIWSFVYNKIILNPKNRGPNTPLIISIDHESTQYTYAHKLAIFIYNFFNEHP